MDFLHTFFHCFEIIRQVGNAGVASNETSNEMFFHSCLVLMWVFFRSEVLFYLQGAEHDESILSLLMLTVKSTIPRN